MKAPQIQRINLVDNAWWSIMHNTIRCARYTETSLNTQSLTVVWFKDQILVPDYLLLDMVYMI
jgi:hypothetical protein